ncbi:MAG: CHAD domain-containing protein [Planctomycetales bacterium]
MNGLSMDSPALDALCRALKGRCERLEVCLNSVSAEDDVNRNEVHKVRVACRRLTAILEILAEEFPDLRQRKLHRAVRDIRRTCGEVRDLDVRCEFLEGLVSQASIEDSEVIEWLCEQTNRQRRWTLRRLQRDWSKLVATARAGAASVWPQFSQLALAPSAPPKSFGAVGARVLRRRLDELWSFTTDDVRRPECLHQLRIVCKRLRYATEVFRPILHLSFREEFYPQLPHLQDLLGMQHDAVEGRRALKHQRRQLRRMARSRHRRRKRLSGFKKREIIAGIDAVRLAYSQLADQARGEFLELWPEFSGRGFRIPVEELLKDLAETRFPPPEEPPATPISTTPNSREATI